MSTLTPEGQRLVQELARRHGFGEEAVTRMLEAIVAGNGRMAQFAHPELGGSGQWMSGGMLMIGAMSDHALKSRVGQLCADMAEALTSIGSPILAERPRGRDEGDAAHSGGSPFLASRASGAWWPEGLGTPSASGSQNLMRYAYFADARRLAVDCGGGVTVHDTLDHRIGGFSQQQGGRDGISVTSQHGTIDLATLPVVSRDGEPTRPPSSPGTSGPVPEPAPADEGSPVPGTSPGVSGDAAREDPLQLIERLGQLHERGLLTDEEFSVKKEELLSRL